MAKLIPVQEEMYDVIPDDDKKFHLKQLQILLGGDIEILPASLTGYCLVVLEDGKRLNLPVNDIATSLNLYPSDPIVGPALYCLYQNID